MRPVNLLVWHCTATPEGKEYSVDTIRQWHKQRGWKDIGYHFVVHLDGKVEAGRPVNFVGAHVQGHNTGSIGCVYVGGVDANDVNKAEDTRTAAQKTAMLKLTKLLVSKYPGIKRIAGHNEFANKACPSFDVRTDPLGNIPGFKAGQKT
jgi:N-acetylmuramoyl-L-alanine amidase